MKTSISTLALVLIPALLACGKATDNTIVEPSRTDRADTIAGRACTKFESCNTYGSGSAFQTRADCIADYKGKALDMWPEDKCGSGRINDAAFNTCADRVDSEACSQGFWDKVSAISDCNSDKVCTDPPH